MTDDVAWKVYPPFFRFFRSATVPALTRAQQRDKGRPADEADLSQFLQAYAKMYPPFFRFFVTIQALGASP